jgi:hypothetical protein
MGDPDVKSGQSRLLLERVAAIPLIDVELIPRSARAVVMSCITAGISALIVWSIYAGGISRGMHHVIAFGMEIDTTPMSVALSESVYGVDLGYIGLASVYNAMTKVLSRGSTSAYDAVIQRNIRDGQVINDAITAAASLGPQSPGYISDRGLITTMYHDMGSVDYIKLSFRLFGNRIEALYYTFFVIIATSSLLFLATFPNSITAQLVLLCTLFAFQLELHTPIFNAGMPTFAGVRHGSTLCLIPVWYFALLTVHKRRASWLLLIIGAGQLAILILAITVRGTATWSIVFLGALAVLCGTYRWSAASRAERTSTLWLRHVASWPVIVLLAAVTIHSQYVKLKLHPVYFTDDILPHHPVWHAAYVGLQYSPELYGFPVRQELLGSDALALDGAMNYLRSVHFIGNETNSSSYDALRAGGYFSEWNGGNPKYRLHDEIMRRVVLQIAREHPWKMLYLYAYKKPMAIWGVSIDLVRRSEPTLKWLMLAGGLVSGLLWIVFASRGDLLEAGLLVPVGMGAVITALLPCVWAYPIAWSVTDGLLLAFAIGVLLLGMSMMTCYLAARLAVSTTARIRERGAGDAGVRLRL